MFVTIVKRNHQSSHNRVLSFQLYAHELCANRNNEANLMRK